MTITNSILFLVAIYIALTILDQNVLDYSILLIKHQRIKIQRFVWLFFNHPFFYINPLTRKIIFFKYYIKSFGIKKELLDEKKETTLEENSSS